MTDKLDLKDRKLLYELSNDSKQSVSKLSKKIGISEQVALYRMNRLLEKGIIKKFVTIVDFQKFGLLNANVYLKIVNAGKEKEQEIIEFAKESPYIDWGIVAYGKDNLILSLFAKNVNHFNELFSEILFKFGEYVINEGYSFNLEMISLPRDYFVDADDRVETKVVDIAKSAKKIFVLDKKDFLLLKELSSNSRKTVKELSEKLKLSGNATAHRIKKLEKEGVIAGYTIQIDSNKVGMTYHRIILKIASSSTKKKLNDLIEFCKMHPNIIFITKSINQIDLEIEAKGPLHFHEILMEIMKNFSNIILEQETSTGLYEIKYDYFPFEKLSDIQEDI
ncbi:MAG: Lrp/AsnC family transcriptional regulator [Candidatus Diapherotrites archaeon]